MHQRSVRLVRIQNLQRSKQHIEIQLYIGILIGNLGGNRYRDGKSENDGEGVVCLSTRVFKKLSFTQGGWQGVTLAS